jgi:hypothetical protein
LEYLGAPQLRSLLSLFTILIVIGCQPINVAKFDPPAIQTVSITNSSPSNTTLLLNYSGVNGRYTHYCILENQSGPNLCNWTQGSLPSSYTFSTTEANVRLSFYIRDLLGNVSQLVQTNKVVSLPFLNGLTQYIKADSSSSTRLSWNGTSHQFSSSISLDGDQAAIGAHGENGTGRVYLFEKESGAWVRKDLIIDEFEGGGIGFQVALDGDTLAISTNYDDNSCSGIFTDPDAALVECGNKTADAGSVIIYRKIAGRWVREAWITSPYPDASDMFGAHIALEGDLLAIGATGDDGSGTGINPTNDNAAPDTGVVYVYKRTGSSWALEATIKPHYSITTADMTFGKVVLSNGTLAVGARNEDSSSIGIDSTPNTSSTNSGAVFIFVRDNDGQWSQQAYIKPSNTVSGDFFGISIALEDDVLAVGASEQDSGFGNSGAVYVFRRTGATWAQEAFLKASDNAAGIRLGIEVAISGNNLIAGAHWEDTGGADSGAAYIFNYNGMAWSQVKKLKASNVDAGDEFGYSVDIDGSDIIVGARYEDSSAAEIDGDELNNDSYRVGAAYAFHYTVDWDQINYIKAHGGGFKRLGRSLHSDGVRLVVGAPFDDGRSGAVYVYQKVAGSWIQEARLVSSNIEINDNFGQTVLVDGDTIFVGAPAEASSGSFSAPNPADNSLSGSGAVYEFRYIAGSWVETNFIKSTNPGASDAFGAWMSWDDDTLAVSAHQEDSSTTGVNSTPDEGASGSGAVYIYRRDLSGNWSHEAYIKAPNTDAGDNFGLRQSIKGDVLVVSSPSEDSASISDLNDDSLADSGIVYIYKRTGVNWVFDQAIKSSNIEAGDVFGNVIEYDGTHLAVAAFGEDGAGSGVQGVPASNTQADSSAVYIFSETAGTFTQEAYLKNINSTKYSYFGMSMSFSGDYVAIGAENDHNSGRGIAPNVTGTSYRSGSVSVFKKVNNEWEPFVYVKSPNADAQDRFGYRVSLQGSTLFASAWFEDSSALSGGNQDLNNAQGSGAVYVFDLDAMVNFAP